MIFIEHRKNRIQDLASVHPANGVEIDLRSHVLQKDAVHLSHDPWVLGDDFQQWVKEFRKLGIRGPIYLNTKEDGLEDRAREILNSQGIDNYLFLDTATPTLVKNVLAGRGSQFFLRLSAYEDLENLLKFAGKIQWVWVDCFATIPLEEKIISEAAKHFRLCLVSPELQGGRGEDFKKFEHLLRYFEAICTKQWKEWEVRV